MNDNQKQPEAPDALTLQDLADYPLDAHTFDEGDVTLGHVPPPEVAVQRNDAIEQLGPDDLRVGTEGQSVFDPLHPDFKLGLTEDQVLHRPAGMPGIEQPAFNLSLNPDELAASHEDQLDSLRDSVIDDRNVVYEFGPFGKMVKNIELGVHQFTDTKVADLVMGKVRRMVHEACLAVPYPTEESSDEKKLLWKQKVLESLTSIEQKEMSDFLKPIEATGRDVTDFHRVIRGHLAHEMAEVDMSKRNLVAPTLGQKLFSKLLSLGRPAASDTGDSLVGDLRRFRNEEVSGALQSIKGATAQISKNAHDDKWMSTEGVRHIERIEKLKNDLTGLTQGIEHQVDMAQINRTLKSAGEDLSQASERVDDPDLQKRIKDLVAGLLQAVDRMVERAATWLRGGAKKEDAPSASRPSMRPA
ncbi:MAG: hypothetical protein O9327_05050 [Polaromonas sp.]|nr:hypothetical protein [Polaromonas sp.]